MQWDNCKCSDCEYCRANKHNQNPAGLHQEPSILIKYVFRKYNLNRSTGQEEVKKIKKTSKQKSNVNAEQDIIPSEQIRTQDGTLIINYEGLDEQEEVVYAGGIKGIRALRMQRDAINHQVDEDLSHQKNEGNKFSKYEEQKR